MKKLFVAQPMRNKSDEEILETRRQAVAAAQKLVGEPLEPINAFIALAPDNTKALWFAGKSLESLAEADIAYFCKDWKDYRGCRMEHAACIEYNIPTLYE